MNKEIKLSIVDICLGYGCTALVMYAIGSIAYIVGKNRGKLEISDKIRDFMKEQAKEA